MYCPVLAANGENEDLTRYSVKCRLTVYRFCLALQLEKRFLALEGKRTICSSQKLGIYPFRDMLFEVSSSPLNIN